MKGIRRGQVRDVNLNPTQGAEIRKVRPCVVVSSDRIGNLPLKVIVPITGWQDQFEEHLWFVKLEPDGQNGFDKLSAADAFQIRSLSVARFIRQRGVL